jgi:hypothetical protein
VRWIPRWRGKASGEGARSGPDRAAAERSLQEWLDVRHGVEVFVEPKTAVTGTTMLLVAHDGEFTRRPVPSPVAAAAFARRHTLPFYDAQVVGYPQRMRDYSRRQTVLRRRAERDRLD